MADFHEVTEADVEKACHAPLLPGRGALLQRLAVVQMGQIHRCQKWSCPYVFSKFSTFSLLAKTQLCIKTKEIFESYIKKIIYN